MHVLVTGHKGYVGMVAVAILQAQGFAVSGIDNDLLKVAILGTHHLWKPPRYSVR